MNILILILLAFGITKIINDGLIFESLRKRFNTFLRCPLCVGFWVGILIGLFYGPFPWWNALFNGSFYSGCVWLLSCLSQYLGNGYDPTRSLIINVDSPIELKKPINNDREQVLKG